MEVKYNGEKRYSMDTLVRALSIMFCHHKLNNIIRQDFHRLSATYISIIAKMASKVKTEEQSFLVH